MVPLILGGSAVVPSLLLFWYVFSKDRNPEPAGLLLRTFLLGALICLPVVPVALGLERAGAGMALGMWGRAGVSAFLGAAIPEELFKFLVLVLFVWRKPAFDEPMDGVVYGATASLGFATLENVLYVSKGGLEVAVLRALTAVPGHAFTGVVMGAFLGRARLALPAERAGLLVASLTWATLLHGLYDMFLMTGSGYAVLAFAVLAVEVIWGRRLIYILRQQQDLLRGPTSAKSSLAASRAWNGASPQIIQALPVDALPVQALPVQAIPIRRPPPAPPGRGVGGWFKLLVGGAGLSLCGLWWLGVLAVLLELDGTDSLPLAGKVGLVLVSLVPTLLFLLLFRSGLRVPPAPAAVVA